MSGHAHEIRRSPEPPLVTRSTILILSSWLIGAATAHLMPAGTEQFATLMGLLGLIAFSGLDCCAQPVQPAVPPKLR